MVCNNCGGSIIGDGVTAVLRCENANEADYAHLEPDANLVECYPKPMTCTECVLDVNHQPCETCPNSAWQYM